MKRIVFLSILFLLIPISRVNAAIVFSEVMYDPPGTDTPWVEVYNNGSQSVDLTKYYFYADGPASTRQGITKKTPGSTLISPGGYAIIADDEVGFASAHPGLSVLDSSFSISSTNNSLLILTTDTTKPPATFDDEITSNPAIGAKNDGNSLQKNSSGIWIAATPTPDAVNNQTAAIVATATDTQSIDSDDTNTDSTAGTNDSSADTSTGPVAEGTPSPNISSTAPFNSPQAHLSVPKNGTVGVAVDITTSLIGVENVRYGMQPFHVSFGDGTEESDFYAKSIAHIYKYPGTYVVYFEYSPSLYFDDEADILWDRKTIEITAPQIEISSVRADGSIELTNSGSKEIDISGWKIASLSDPNIFLQIPFGTSVLAGKRITLATDQAGFSDKNTDSVGLVFPSGQVAATYVKPVDQKINTVQTNIASAYTNNIAAFAAVPKMSGTKIASAKNSKKVALVKSKKLLADHSDTLTEKDIATSSDQNATQMLAANSLGGIDGSGSESQMEYVFIIVIAITGIALVAFFALKFAKPISLGTNATDEKTPQNIADDIRILDD